MWSACSFRQGACSLSVVGRLSALRSVHYRRFHCAALHGYEIQNAEVLTRACNNAMHSHKVYTCIHS